LTSLTTHDVAVVPEKNSVGVEQQARELDRMVGPNVEQTKLRHHGSGGEGVAASCRPSMKDKGQKLLPTTDLTNTRKTKR